MPKQRFEHHEPTHGWHELRPLLKDPTQITYEIIRPVIVGWETSDDIIICNNVREDGQPP